MLYKHDYPSGGKSSSVYAKFLDSKRFFWGCNCSKFHFLKERYAFTPSLKAFLSETLTVGDIIIYMLLHVNNETAS